MYREFSSQLRLILVKDTGHLENFSRELLGIFAHAALGWSFRVFLD